MYWVDEYLLNNTSHNDVLCGKETKTHTHKKQNKKTHTKTAVTERGDNPLNAVRAGRAVRAV